MKPENRTSVLYCALFFLMIFPLGLSPVSAQQSEQKLTSTGGEFGSSVAISGDRAVFGAPGESNDRGAAFVFERDGGGSWKETFKLTASDGSNGARFGNSVTIAGSRIVVGSNLEASLGFATGAAYVFERQGDGSWLQVAKLTASDKKADTFFGESVSMDGDLALVGAPGTGAQRSGAAYLFQRQMNDTWTEIKKLTASDGDPDDGFGQAVSVSGTRVLIGTYVDQDAAVNGGSAYIFEKQQDDSWKEMDKLTASDAQDFDGFGNAVSLSGERALIGGFATGSAYVFDRQQDGTWSETANIKSSSVHASQFFGRAVSLLGNRALVSDLGDAPNPSVVTGTALVFERRQDGSWEKIMEVSSSGDFFGGSVALSEAYAMVGAPEGNAVYAYELDISTAVGDFRRTTSSYALEAPFPNPFREQATIRYFLPYPGEMRLFISDVAGQPVRVLKQGLVQAGQHEAQIDAQGLAPGLYFVGLEIPEGGRVRKMMVID